MFFFCYYAYTVYIDILTFIILACCSNVSNSGHGCCLALSGMWSTVFLSQPYIIYSLLVVFCFGNSIFVVDEFYFCFFFFYFFYGGQDELISLLLFGLCFVLRVSYISVVQRFHSPVVGESGWAFSTMSHEVLYSILNTLRPLISIQAHLALWSSLKHDRKLLNRVLNFFFFFFFFYPFVGVLIFRKFLFESHFVLKLPFGDVGL